MGNLNRRRGKENERYYAKRFGGRRLGTMGKVDVEIPGCAIECKERKTMPAFIRNGLRQARANKLNGEHQLPIFTIHEHNTDHDEDAMVMRLVDWEKMYRKWREG
jgi:hypothetical protein